MVRGGARFSARAVRSALVPLAAWMAQPATARADRPADLSLKQLPTPTPASLTMRPRPARRPRRLAAAPSSARGAAGSPPPATAATALPTVPPPPPLTPAGHRTPATGPVIAGPAARLEDQVIFRFDLGFGIDAGEPSGQPRLDGSPLDSQDDYARLRSYGYGDLEVGTRGLLVPSLATYMAAEFRFNQSLVQPSSAVPSVYDNDRQVDSVLIHSGYAEADHFFQRPWLRPLYLRAGRQYTYGIAVAHFDGVTIGYDTPPVSLSLWTGRRVSLYGPARGFADQHLPTITGASARVDLYELRRIPVVLTGSSLDSEGIHHTEVGLALHWNKNVLISASARRLGSSLARAGLSLWARLSPVTTFNIDLDNRTSSDWVYDLVVLRTTPAPGEPRAYLNLGPPLPRAQIDVRAGTVLLDNFDVLVRGAAALEHAGGDEDAPFSPTYLEAGAALEVRLRRNLRLGSSFTARGYRRPTITTPQMDQPGVPDALPQLGAQVGERSFYEGGLGVHYSMGARRFNASAELYARMYRRQTPYQPDVVEPRDVHSGGRFSVEGWAAKRLRVKAEYDVSISAIQVAPELRGVKSLRILAEGTF